MGTTPHVTAYVAPQDMTKKIRIWIHQTLCGVMRLVSCDPLICSLFCFPISMRCCAYHAESRYAWLLGSCWIFVVRACQTCFVRPVLCTALQRQLLRPCRGVDVACVCEDAKVLQFIVQGKVFNLDPTILSAEGESHLTSLTNSAYQSMVQLDSQAHPVVDCRPAIFGIVFIALNHAHEQQVCTSATDVLDDCRPSFNLPESFTSWLCHCSGTTSLAEVHVCGVAPMNASLAGKASLWLF